MIYDKKIAVNKLEISNSLLYIKTKQKYQTKNHSTKLETTFSGLVAMNNPASESLQVPILVLSLSSLPQYSLFSTFINIKDDEAVT